MFSKIGHNPSFGALEVLKYIGPGLLVTVGFIDPGNWASNIAAGSQFGYSMLWMVTLSTLMLFVLQHNAAHLGIATGLCLSEASTKTFGVRTSRAFLLSAVAASVCTALAEILGTAIGLNMLFKIPLGLGATLTTAMSVWLLLGNGYRMIERWIIGFVSLVGISFLIELALVKVDWGAATVAWISPELPAGSIPIMMSVLGAVVMPHNLFLHSEIIQSRQWNLQGEDVIKRQLNYEFTDTLFAMLLGWGINSAMIIVAAAVFFANGIVVTELQQAQETLRPMVGSIASTVFALALIFAGFSSSITAGMAGGSIFAGIFMEPFDLKDPHSRYGVLITLIGALIVIFMLGDPFSGLIWSQIALSVQLPWTAFALVTLTSSRTLMGKFANTRMEKFILWTVVIAVVGLNILLLVDLLRG